MGAMELIGRRRDYRQRGSMLSLQYCIGCPCARLYRYGLGMVQGCFWWRSPHAPGMLAAVHPWFNALRNYESDT